MNSDLSVSHNDVLHQGNGLVDAHLGHSYRGCLILVFTSPAMEWESIVKTSSIAYFGFTIEKCELALEVWVMSVGTRGAGVEFIKQFEDIFGTEFTSSTCI